MIIYSCNVWYTPEGVKRHRKGMVKRLRALQGTCLRRVAGAYRAISTEAVEIETNTLPINIHIEKLVANATRRLREAPALRAQKQTVERI
jgi:hypothetical protein